MRTEELASSAMAMDKVDLCGRAINVGRPKGYVEPPQVTLLNIAVFCQQAALTYCDCDMSRICRAPSSVPLKNHSTWSASRLNGRSM